MTSYDPFEEDLAAIYQDYVVENRFRDLKAIVALALGCGWRGVSGKGIIFISNDGTQTQINLPRDAHLKISVFRHHINTIIRHRSAVPHANGLYGAPVSVLVEQIASQLKLDHSHVRIMTDAVAKNAVPVVVENAEPVPPAETGGTVKAAEPAPAVSDATPPVVERHIVSMEPWSAHGRRRGEGTEVYPSDAVTQRNWSDSTKDYICSDEDCGWTNDNPISVSRHYGAKHTRGMGKQPQPAADGVDTAWESPLRKRRIAKLRGEVDGALIAALAAGVPADAQWIATWIIDHRPDPEGTVHTEGEGGHFDSETGEWVADPITAEQIVEQMAALLERHTGRAKVLREQVEAQDAVLQQYQSERDAAVSRAERAEGNLHALRDMLNEADD